MGILEAYQEQWKNYITRFNSCGFKVSKEAYQFH